MVVLASLFFMKAMPLDMPRAEAYLVTEPSGKMRLEDRYDELDIWTSHAVLGRWLDDSGRLFTVARLHEVAPEKTSSLTRSKYASETVTPDKKEFGVRDLAISKLSPFPLPEKPHSPRMPIRGFKEVLYFHGTNTTSVVAAFLPEEKPYWYLAVWDMLPEDDFEAALENFEEKFLCEWDEIVKRDMRSERKVVAPPKKNRKKRVVLSEKELLRRDAAFSVTNYPSWNVTDAKEFTILDNLKKDSSFVSTLTNELGLMRAKYAETVPSPIDGSNVLSVARIFRTRGEYLDALEVNDVEGMEWSAAYWSSKRRELVAYLPDEGAAKLLKTIRHEAFHQYLAYASSMIPSSPWFNEGYAQYFEEGPDGPSFVDPCDLVEMADTNLPAIFMMDYDEFYAGTDMERRLKYRLALSVAYFIEKGAPEIAREPFKNLKRDYMNSLLKNRDMRKATLDAFGSAENFKRFIAEWKKFWQAM